MVCPGFLDFLKFHQFPWCPGFLEFLKFHQFPWFISSHGVVGPIHYAVARVRELASYSALEGVVTRKRARISAK